MPETEEDSKFKIEAKKTEDDIIALLSISEEKDEFSEQEIEDLTSITEHSSRLYRVKIFIAERKHDYHCISLYLNNPSIQKHLFPWINKTYSNLQSSSDERASVYIEKLEKVVKDSIKELVVISPENTNAIIETMFGGDHDLTLTALSETPRLKYDYIKKHF